MEPAASHPTNVGPATRHWRAVAGAGGHAGNDRLTSSVGLVLFVLLTVEALTTLALSSYLSVHMFLGLLLLPPIVLKLAPHGLASRVLSSWLPPPQW